VSIERRALSGQWIHAHEQDSSEEMVFVPAGRELPPSRGRQQLELNEDGAAREWKPGSTDRPEARGASWELTADDQLVIRDEAGESESWRARVLAADESRLVLDKASIQ
jgi:hypothetical protein